MFKRKGSNNWQESFSIPIDLWRQRAKLIEMGFVVPATKQVNFSTKTADKARAERAVAAKQIE